MGGAIIAINVIVMLLQLEYEGTMLKDNVYSGEKLDTPRIDLIEDMLAVSEHLFTAFFAFELIFRLAALGIGYLKSVANLFDAFIDEWCLLSYVSMRPYCNC